MPHHTTHKTTAIKFPSKEINLINNSTLSLTLCTEYRTRDPTSRAVRVDSENRTEAEKWRDV